MYNSAMSTKKYDDDDDTSLPENEFDVSEDSRAEPASDEIDIALLRAAITEHGKSLADIEAVLGRHAIELEEMRTRAKRNSRNIRTLAHKLGFDLVESHHDEHEKDKDGK